MLRECRSVVSCIMAATILTKTKFSKPKVFRFDLNKNGGEFHDDHLIVKWA